VQIITVVQNNLRDALHLLGKDLVTSSPIVHDKEDNKKELLQQMFADKGSCTTFI